MYAKKHRPMQKLTAICLSVTIAAASLLSGHVFASDEAPQTDYLTGQELLAELREMGLGQDVILDEEAPESDNSSETNTEDPSDTTGEPGDGDQTDGTEPGNPDEGGSGEGATDPGESTPEQPGDGDQTGSTEPGNPDEGGSGEGNTDTDTDPGTDNPDNSDPAASTDPDEGDGAEQDSDQNQPSAPAESTESAPDESTGKDVPLVTQNDEMTVNDPQIPGETPASEEDDNISDEDKTPENDNTSDEDKIPENDNTSDEGKTPEGGDTSNEGETPENSPSQPESSEGELPETSGITEEQRAELAAYVQTLDAEQVVSLDETDITTEEYDDLYSMLTADQLAAIEALLAGPNGEEIYNLIMAAQTLDEVNAILDSLDQAGLNALFGYMSEEQYAAMMDWIDVLEQAAIETALSGGTVNFTDAAPLTGSASAGAPSTVMRRSAARAALYAPPSEEGNDALELSKRVEETEDGYQLVLEAYATGEVTSSTETKTVPTDIVLVLDQSGSMTEYMDTDITYTRTDETLASELYKIEDDLYILDEYGDYRKVTIQRKDVWSYVYSKVPESGRNNRNWGNLYCWNNRENLYYLTDNGDYVEVLMEYSWWDEYYTYTVNGQQYTSDQDSNELPSELSGRLYVREYDYQNRLYEYTFAYRDADGRQVQETVTDTSEQRATAPDWQFYVRSVGDRIQRLEALKDAVSDFIGQVQESAIGKDGQLGTDDDVNHRIAMVGFANGSGSKVMTGTYEESDWWGGSYTVTGIEYSEKGSYDYNSVVGSALMNVTDNEDYRVLTGAVEGLNASGGTMTNQGLEMANDIFNAYEEDYGQAYEDGTRQKVVIVFTDGVPGLYGFDDVGNPYFYDGNISGMAIESAKNIKDGGATVYTIGIFDGADASDPSNLPDYTQGSVEGKQETDNANRFMHLVSSNYPNAIDMDRPGPVNDKLQGNGYYLSASDADALNEIFQTISDQIETPSTTVKLDGNAVLRDVITPYFDIDISDDRNVKAQIVPYAGNNAWDWEAAKNVNRDNIDIDTATNTVDVTGYDYSDEYIWDNKNTGTHGGSKLVVTIPIERDPYFIGGNGVPTNETTSGIYANDEAQGAFETFPVPSVNVPIHYGFDVTDKTIYLSQSQKIDFAAGGVFYDNGRAAASLGGDAKANDYVDITYTVTDSEGNPVGTYTIPAKGTSSWNTNVPPELTPADCAELTITCTVTPIHDADSTQATQAVGTPAGPKLVNPSETAGGDDDKNADIHVLKPTLNFKDTYEDGPTNNYALTENQKDDFITWSDFNTGHAANVASAGEAPDVTLHYTWMGNPSGVITDGKVNLTETANFQVNSITINGKEYTVGEGVDADYHVTSECSYVKDDLALEKDHIEGRHFTIHLPSEFDLTITKTKPGNYVDGETFRFKVSGEDFYAEFTLGEFSDGTEDWSITLKDLKPGEYTITEDQGWSWRYNCGTITPNGGVDSETEIIDLGNGTYTATFNDDATVTFTNQKTENHWLSWEDTKVNVFNPAS
ncbi:MAG TPA: hypothetical protein IAB55_10665 [Candidatus Merdivicinus faecavium]|nr:hypothetical protein [Candidatus Merdivicinus faecavium]